MTDRPGPPPDNPGGTLTSGSPQLTGEAIAAGVRPGDVLAKKYRVERVIGEGAMGIVVAARHLQLDEMVALKFLLPRAMTSPDAVGRFAREARAAAKIKSEHVARASDVGELENGAPYIVMEYLEGSDLGALLAAHGRLPPDHAVGYVLEACEALAEAHVLGIVHRDIKPANLFLAKLPGGAPIIKVLDFGISKGAVSASQPELTKTSAIMGSPLYMSPEQMRSAKTVDARSDIWALGAVLYELVGGQPPFRGESLPELILAILQTQQEPLRQITPNVPVGLEKVINRCLAKDPAARFTNVGELARALAPFGPPRGELSVERISQVLAAADPADPGDPLASTAASPAGLALPPPVGMDTRSGAPSSPPESMPEHTVRAPMMASAATTTKPVSSGAESIPGAGSGGSPRWALPMGGLVALVVAGILVWRGISPSSTVVAPLASQPEPKPSETSPQPQSSWRVVDLPPPPPLDGSVHEADAASPAAASHFHPPVPQHPPSARASASVPPKPDCNPPYTIDSAGLRHYKRECTN